MTSTPAQAQPPAPRQALLQAVGTVFGVDATRLLQVLPRSADMQTLPRAGRSLVGVLPFRDRAVPVVDLRHWQGNAAETSGTEPDQIAVLADGTDWIGLLIERAVGLAAVQPERLQRLHHDENPAEFFHSTVPRADGSGWLTLLDPARLMRTAQTWSAGQPCSVAPVGDHAVHDGPVAHDMATASLAEKAAHTAPQAVLRMGQRLFALPTTGVAEVLARPALQTVWGSGSTLLGMLRWRGRDVPLVNPADEIGQALAADAPWVVIVCDTRSGTAGPLIALPCHGVDRVDRLPLGRIQSAGQPGSLCAPACQGLLLQDDGQTLYLLDADQLVGTHQLPLDRSESAAHDAGTISRNPGALVVFQARKPMAVPIGQLEAIEALPAAMTADIASGSHTWPDTLTWRNRALPLVCLQQRLWPGQTPVTESRRILIAELDGQLSAVLVGEVDQLIPPLAGQISRARMPDGSPLELVTHEQDGHPRSYELIDFSTLPPA